MRIVNARTGAEVDVSEPVAERRIGSGRWAPVSDGPSESDLKATWVDHAVSQGADRAEAEVSTKADLIADYGS